MSQIPAWMAAWRPESIGRWHVLRALVVAPFSIFVGGVLVLPFNVFVWGGIDAGGVPLQLFLPGLLSAPLVVLALVRAIYLVFRPDSGWAEDPVSWLVSIQSFLLCYCLLQPPAVRFSEALPQADHSRGHALKRLVSLPFVVLGVTVVSIVAVPVLFITTAVSLGLRLRLPPMLDRMNEWFCATSTRYALRVVR